YSAAAVLAARRGRGEEARRQIELTIHHQKAFGHFHHGQYDVGCALALLGQRDEAVTWLRETAKNGLPCYPLFRHDPLLASLRDPLPYVRLLGELQRELREHSTFYVELRATASGATTLYSR